jgi:Carboxypeptidase regulatory-like domain
MAVGRILTSSCVFLLAVQGAATWERAGGIEGHVTLNLSRPLGNVSVSADNRLLGLHFESVSNASGYYSLTAVPSGRYSMFADAKSVGCILIPHAGLNEGEHLRQDFDFERRGKKEGCEAREK